MKTCKLSSNLSRTVSIDEGIFMRSRFEKTESVFSSSWRKIKQPAERGAWSRHVVSCSPTSGSSINSLQHGVQFQQRKLNRWGDDTIQGTFIIQAVFAGQTNKVWYQSVGAHGPGAMFMAQWMTCALMSCRLTCPAGTGCTFYIWFRFAPCTKVEHSDYIRITFGLGSDRFSPKYPKWSVHTVLVHTLRCTLYVHCTYNVRTM